MEKAKVYFSDFRTIAFGMGLPQKLKKLITAAGIGDLEMEGKFVAIKMHFGELGNVSYLQPNYARAVVDVVKELGGASLPDRLQHHVPRQPEKRLGTLGLRLGKRLYPHDRGLPPADRRRTEGYR